MPYKDPADKQAWRRRYRINGRQYQSEAKHLSRKAALGLKHSEPLDPIKRAAYYQRKAKNLARAEEYTRKKHQENINRRAAYLALRETLEPRLAYHINLLTDDTTMWRDCSAAIPMYLPPRIKDAIGRAVIPKPRTQRNARTGKSSTPRRRATRRWHNHFFGYQKRHLTERDIKTNRAREKRRRAEEQAAYELALEFGLFTNPPNQGE